MISIQWHKWMTAIKMDVIHLVDTKDTFCLPTIDWWRQSRNNRVSLSTRPFDIIWIQFIRQLIAAPNALIRLLIVLGRRNNEAYNYCSAVWMQSNVIWVKIRHSLASETSVPDPRKWGHYLPAKRRKTRTGAVSVKSLENWILHSTAMKACKRARYSKIAETTQSLLRRGRNWGRNQVRDFTPVGSLSESICGSFGAFEGL